MFGKRKKQNLQKEAAHKLAEADRARRAGNLSEAEAAAREALEIFPDKPAAALSCLAAVLNDQGRAEEAFDAYQKSLAAEADQALVYAALADMCLARGKPDEALYLADKACEAAPGLNIAKITRAGVLEQLGEEEKALEELSLAYRVAARDADNIAALTDFIARRGVLGAGWQDGEAATLAAFRAGAMEGHKLAAAAGEILNAKYAFAAQGSEPENELLDRLAEDELFIRLLQECLNIRPEIETFCTLLRRKILTEHGSSEELPSTIARLAAAIALQMHQNGYVVSGGGDEDGLLAAEDRRLGELVAAAGTGVPSAARAALLLFAMYRPLAARADADRLLDLPFGGEAGRLILLTVREGRELAAEAARIADLSAYKPPPDATEAAVTPWQHFAPPGPATLTAHLRRQFPGFTPPAWCGEASDIFFPRCGSGRAAVDLALSLPACSIAAADPSVHALAYGARRALKLGAGNISFTAGDLLPGTLAGRQFHYIDARNAGALAPAAETLATLAGYLAPGGLLRFDISWRERAESLRTAFEIGASRAGGSLEAARHDILRDGGSACAYLMRQAEFYDLGGCQGLINAAGQGGASAEALAAAVSHAGLHLIGQFAPADLRARYRTRHGDDPLMKDLARYESFMREFPLESGGMFRLFCRKPE